MDLRKITDDWLKVIEFKRTNNNINGVVIRELKVNLDGRGDLIELWSQSWEEGGIERVKHSYQTITDYQVIKAWHLHAKHVDQLAVISGKVQIVLVDVRSKSRTFGYVNSTILGSKKPALIKIPAGVLHGWKALSTPEVSIINYMTELYDASDELKFPYDCILEDIWEPKNG